MGLRDRTLMVARAGALKEAAADLWEYRYVGAARVPSSAAGISGPRIPNVPTDLRHRITNATTEGLNSKIQWLWYPARGFRNRENFKTAIYFPLWGPGPLPTLLKPEEPFDMSGRHRLTGCPLDGRVGSHSAHLQTIRI